MNNSRNDELVAKYALALFVIGLLAPFIISIFSQELAGGFLLICELLALILGVVAWRQKIAKVVVGSIVIMFLTLGISWYIWMVAPQLPQ